MDTPRVLINNAGSQAADIARLLSRDGIETICLSATDNPAIRNNACVFEKEENIPDISDYLDYLIAKCVEHKADAFIPFRRVTELATYHSWFEDENIRFIAPDDTRLRIFNDKVQTYNYLKDGFPEIIPKFRTLRSLAPEQGNTDKLTDFLDSLEGDFACIKKRSDISGSSFRKVSLDRDGIPPEKMFSPEFKNTISYSDFMNMMLTCDVGDDLMIVEYLPGREVSCDCLYNGGRMDIIVPRIKLNPKTQLITRNPQLVEICEDILETSGYYTPCNIQFRMEDGQTPKLLEINTRMSGGIYLASKATGINIPAIAVRHALGEDVRINKDFPTVTVVAKTDYYFFEGGKI